MQIRNKIKKEQYRVGSCLGRGSEGSVYVAEDLILGRKVALKFFQGKEDILESEVNYLKIMEHPNIPSFYETWEEKEGVHIIAMELVEGKRVTEYLNGVMPEEEELYLWGKKLGEILESLENKKPSIVHRDLKPENTMITEDGELWLLDFGAATSSNIGQIWEGEKIGSIGYAAPEQFKGMAVDETADIYSLGALLFDLAVGRSFRTEPEKRKTIREYRQDIPVGMDKIIHKCLQKNNFKRYGNAKLFLNDWNNYKRKGLMQEYRSSLLRAVGVLFLLVILAILIHILLCGQGRELLFVFIHLYLITKLCKLYIKNKYAKIRVVKSLRR